MKQYNWLNDVLADLAEFCAENNLPITSKAIREAEKKMIEERAERSAVCQGLST